MCDTDFHSGEIRLLRTINVSERERISGIFLCDQIMFAVYNTKEIAKYSDGG